MATIPKIIHQIWLGGRVPSRIARLIATIKEHNPDWEHRLIDEKEAERLSGKSWAELKNYYWKYSSVSNLIRLLAVYRDGGLYLDTDFQGVKSFNDLPQSGAYTAVIDDVKEYGAPDRICCAAFGAEPGHPWLKWQIDNCSRVKEKDAAWGVHLMSIAPRDGLTLVPTETFYPWNWDAQPADQVIHPLTVAAHLWDGDWRACT